MIKVNKLLYSGFFVALVSFTLHFYYLYSLNPFKPESSVWCLKGSNQSSICKFRNICYDLQFKTFLFFLGNNTIIKGFSHYSELQKIQLSSVQPHNRFYANLSVIDDGNYLSGKKLTVYSKFLLFSRFKPNNIMHSIHDDLLPVFLTLEFVCSGDIKCIENYSLMFHDDLPKGPFFKLYSLFSKHPPLVPRKFNSGSDILCFDEMLTGLILDGIFYQYGFKKPHGPVRATSLNQHDISRFTSYIMNKLEISTGKSNLEVVLLSREKNRKILNVLQIKDMIENMYKKLNNKVKVKLINLDLFSNDLVTLIEIISKTDVLIGMHGAEMILSLFMKPGSFVCEIFPFGINPNVVSFIKPVSELEGSNFRYYYWRNMLKNNSVAHPDAHPLFGGIVHLDKKTQKEIENTVQVPPVECCNNPLFLYHMYQDTWLSNEFVVFLYESLFTSTQLKSVNMTEKWFYPSKVFNVSCKFLSEKQLLSISWNPPLNVHNKDVKYSLYIKDQKGLFGEEISTEKTAVEVELPGHVSPVFEVWISTVFINNSKSPDLYLKCN